MNEQNIDDLEETRTATLGKALQDARLSASLTVEEVAEQLNLAVSTVRDIEDALELLIEKQKYPHIYLRGYLANYAKLVALEKLEQFPEYQQLSGSQTPPKNLRPSIKASPAKNWSRWLLLLLILTVVLCLGVFIAQQVFFSESKADLPKSEKIKPDNEKSVADIAVINGTAETDASAIADKTEDADSLNIVLQKSAIAAAQKMAGQTQAAGEPEKEVITEDPADAQLLLFEPEVTAINALTIESLQLTFSADCWTEIVDATGKRLAFDLYKQGASVTLKGVAPFKLKLGDPSAVTIQYQNKTFEHKFAAGRAVRFTVPQSLS